MCYLGPIRTHNRNSKLLGTHIPYIIVERHDNIIYDKTIPLLIFQGFSLVNWFQRKFWLCLNKNHIKCFQYLKYSPTYLVRLLFIVNICFAWTKMVSFGMVLTTKVWYQNKAISFGSTKKKQTCNRKISNIESKVEHRPERIQLKWMYYPNRLTMQETLVIDTDNQENGKTSFSSCPIKAHIKSIRSRENFNEIAAVPYIYFFRRN